MQHRPADVITTRGPHLTPGLDTFRLLENDVAFVGDEMHRHLKDISVVPVALSPQEAQDIENRTLHVPSFHQLQDQHIVLCG